MSSKVAIPLLDVESDQSDDETFEQSTKDIDSDDEFDDLIWSEVEVNKPTEKEPEEYLEYYHKYRHDFQDPDNIKEEPILAAESERLTILPIEYQDIWDNYNAQRDVYWVTEEINLDDDKIDWETKLSKDDRRFIMHVLAFFAASDGIVANNLSERFRKDVKIKEAKCAYSRQEDMENTHGHTYSLMLKTFVKDGKLQDKLFNAIKTMPCVKRKAEWCQKWIDSDLTFAHRVIAFVAVEGIFFSGAFCALFWLKTRPGYIMKGLLKSNKFIARDEGLHVDLAVLIYKHLKNRLLESVVYTIIEEAVALEEEFINVSLPCRLLGINSILMSQYIRYVADRLLFQLGYNKKYNVTCPFDFMLRISLDDKQNFFEERNDSYKNPHTDNDWTFSTEAAF